MTRQVIQVIRSRPRLDPKLYFLNKTLFIFLENVTLSHLFGVRSKMIFSPEGGRHNFTHQHPKNSWAFCPKMDLKANKE